MMWASYSRKLTAKITNPHNIGLFTVEDASSRRMRLVTGEDGEIKDGNFIRFYWLVDESDGVIADAKFQVFGESALIGAAEIACDLFVHKNYDQAMRISADLIDKHVRDKADQPAFPEETSTHINLVIGAIDDAAKKCFDIPFADSYVSTPIAPDLMQGDGFPGWTELNSAQKLALIEQVIASDIRPYIELDAGGIQVLEFKDDRELIIGYQGSCTSCYSATGSTLSAIQQILQAKLDRSITVTPDLSFLKQ